MRERGLFLTCVAVLLFTGVFWTGLVSAAPYPEKPLEIICPYAPGSTTDILLRVITDVGSKYFGQPMVVVNKPGAGGALAAADVISSKPDGYKVFWGAHVFFATTIKTQKVPFNPDDLAPLANFVELKMGMVVKGDSSFKNFDDLLNYARKAQGQFKWAHVGRGIGLHMSGMVIFRKAGIATIDVPYKGTAEALVALLGGHVDAASLAYGAMSEQVAAGKARYLMFYTDKRFKDHPDVPTAVELGFPNAVLPAFFGLYVRRDTPEPIRKVLAETCKKITEDPETRKGIERVGEAPRFGGPEFVREEIRKQEAVGIPILKELGLYVGK